jgi:hypothetical protein
MTPHEFWLIYDGRVRAANAASGRVPPPTQAEIDEFERGLPDELKS